MADRFPLIVDADNTNIKELPSGDNLDLTGSDIVNVVDVTTSGNMVVGGNLTVNGTTTTINSATLTIDDKNIVLASGAADAAAANGAGITIDGASANLLYSSSTDGFSFNKGVTVPSLTTTGNISFGDNDKAIFGAGSDLQIYHDGSHSYVDDQGTGQLRLRGTTQIQFLSGANDYMATMANDGAVTLYYDNSAKLATTSTGIDVTGVITTDGMTTSADINFGDNDKAIFGAGSDLQIYHTGSQSIIRDAGTGDLQLLADASITLKNSAGTTTKAEFISGGAVNLYHNNALKLATTSTGIDVTGTVTTTDVNITSNTPVIRFTESDQSNKQYQLGSFGSAFAIYDSNNSQYRYVLDTNGNHIFNEGSTDSDFRVESNGNTHALFVDAGNDRVGVLTSSPAAPLDIQFGDNANILRGSYASSEDNFFLELDSAIVTGGVVGYQFHLTNNGTAYNNTLTLDRGNVGVGVQSADAKLHVSGNFLAESSTTLNSTIRATGNNTRAIGNYQAHDSSGNDVNMVMGVFGDANRGEISTNTNHTLRFYVNNTPSKYLEIATTGQVFTSHGLIVNEDSNDSDFRVESNNNSHMLFVDAGGDHVSIGTSNDYGKALNVNGGLEVRGTGDALELQQSSAGSATYYAMDNTVETGGKRWRFGYTGASSDKASFTFYNQTDDEIPLFMGAGRINLNHSSDDVDTVIKSVDCTDMFAVDAGTNQVLITGNAGNTGTALRVRNNFNNVAKILQDATSLSNNTFAFEIDSSAQVSNLTSAGAMKVDTFYGNAFEINGMGTTIINEAGAASGDFRVESNSNTHMLFVDAGNNYVGIAESSPDALLHINATSNGNFQEAIRLTNAGGGSNEGAFIRFEVANTDGHGAIIGARRSGLGGVDLRFDTGEISGSPVTAMTIDHDQNVGIGVANGDVRSDGNANRTYVGIIGSGTRGVLNIGTTAANGADGGAISFVNGANELGALYNDAVSGSQTTGTMYLTSTGALDVRAQGGVVFNEDSIDCDFRVESNNEAYMIRVDGGNDRLGIKTNAPQDDVHMNATSGVGLMMTRTSGATSGQLGNIRFGNTNIDSNLANIGAHQDGATDSAYLSFETQPTGAATVERLRLKSASEAVFNDSSSDYDFRVESDNKTHALFVDASTDKIFIGGNGTSDSDVATVNATNQSTWASSITEGILGLARYNNTQTSGQKSDLFFRVTTDNSGHNANGAISLVQPTTNSNHSNFQFNLRHGNGTRYNHMTLDGQAGAVFNDTGQNFDFRVESDIDNSALFVDASTSRVGINQNTPSTHLHVKGTNDTDGAALILQEANNNTSDTIGTVFFGNNSSNKLGRIIGFTSGSSTTCTLRFMSTSNGGNAVNNLDIASSNVTFNENAVDCDFRVESDNSSYGIYLDAANDRLLVGRGDVSTGEDFFAVDAKPGTSGQLVRTGRDDNSTKNHFVFMNPNGAVGSIQTTGSQTLFNTSSDARLKENIANADDAGELIDAIQVRQFDWIEDGEHQRYGMVAQELNTVAPEAVSEGETEDDMMGVDYSKLVPMLIKEIQALRARVAQLESN